jgi:actin related protein 2/3 complex subunit 3
VSCRPVPDSQRFPSPYAASAETLKGFLRQLREALVPRLLERVYAPDAEGGAPNKFWLAFSKRKFINREFA